VDAGPIDAPFVPVDVNLPDAGFVEGCGPLDVVFVLDVSSSMGFVLDQLGQQIGSVVTAANALAPEAHFGLVVFADNHRLDTTGPGGSPVPLGAASLEAIRTVLPEVLYDAISLTGDAVRASPGLAAKHYAPRTRVVLVDAGSDLSKHVIAAAAVAARAALSRPTKLAYRFVVFSDLWPSSSPTSVKDIPSPIRTAA